MQGTARGPEDTVRDVDFKDRRLTLVVVDVQNKFTEAS